MIVFVVCAGCERGSMFVGVRRELGAPLAALAPLRVGSCTTAKQRMLRFERGGRAVF